MEKHAPNYNLWRLIKHIWNVLLLKTGQRISVWEYILAWIYLNVISYLLWLLVGDVLILSALINILVLIYSFALMIRRLHDQWKKRTHIFYILIPIYNIIRCIRVALYKWTPWQNAFGPDPLEKQPKSNRVYWSLRLLWFWVYLLLLIATIILGISSGLHSSKDTNFSYTTWDLQRELWYDSDLVTGTSVEK